MSYLGTSTKDQTFTLASGQTLTGFQVVIPNASQTNVDDFEVLLSDAGTTVPLGVAQLDDNVVITGPDTVTVRIWGVTKVRAAKAITYGAHLVATANGMVTDANPATGKFFCGYAMTTANQLGDEMLMLIDREVNEA